MYRLIAFFTMISFVFAAPLDAQAAKKKSTADNPKYASMVIDADTGAILSERYPDRSVHPASLTKVMTLLLLFEAMESGTVRPNDKILISQRAASQAPSKIGLPAGSSIRVEDAILAIVTKSANDIAVAVAEHLAGSEPRFAERMTYRARSLGMTRTSYQNAHGLHNPRQVTTARDQATLARYVIARYPNYYRYFSTKQFTYRGKTYTNHNRLMQTYPGMDGFKTGFINASGFNLIASAKKGDRRLIGVVFGGRSWKSRNDHMAALLNGGWSKLSEVRYASAPVQPLAGPVAAVQYPPPIPATKPVFKTTQTAAIAPAPTGAAPQSATITQTTSFTSLGSLNNAGAKVVVETAAAPDVTGDAIAKVQNAMNSGEYSEVTGEGDYDAATARRVETGLLAAAVYKGEARYIKKNAAPLIPVSATSAAPIIVDPARTLQAPANIPSVQPIALPPQQQQQTLSASELWSVQIGAYTSRVATDDALRRAQSKLPATLTHASPIVVPLTTGEGVLFRARLGNLTQAQANEACRHFRDCLPVAPR